MKRHNLAIENLTKAREAWYKAEVRKKDEIAKKRQELLAFCADMSSVDKALDALRKIIVIYHEDSRRKRTFMRRPELCDFYRPGTEMRNYQNLAMGVFGVASELVVGFLV